MSNSLFSPIDNHLYIADSCRCSEDIRGIRGMEGFLMAHGIFSRLYRISSRDEYLARGLEWRSNTKLYWSQTTKRLQAWILWTIWNPSRYIIPLATINLQLVKFTEIILFLSFEGHQSFLWDTGTSWNVWKRFQSQVGSLACMCTSSPVHNVFFRFNCSAISANLLVADTVAEPFWPSYFLV